MISTDFYFRKGSTHKVCEDYALASPEESERKYAILSDGCSSSPHTDFGSRILAASAANMIAVGVQPHVDTVSQRASTIAQTLGLPKESIDATLLTASIRDHTWHGGKKKGQTEPIFDVRIMGDGAYVRRNRKTGELTTIRYIFEPSMPSYPSYACDGERMKAYIKMNPTVKIRIDRQHETYPGENDEIDEGILDRGFYEGGYNQCANRDYIASTGSSDLVLLFSDGIETFYHRDTQEFIGWEWVIEHLTAFKGYAGSFITRRCNKFFKMCEKEGIMHSDDFSMAGIYVS